MRRRQEAAQSDGGDAKYECLWQLLTLYLAGQSDFFWSSAKPFHLANCALKAAQP